MLVGDWLGCRRLFAGLISGALLGWLVGWLKSFGWEFSVSLLVVRFILVGSLVQDYGEYNYVKVSFLVKSRLESSI